MTIKERRFNEKFAVNPIRLFIQKANFHQKSKQFLPTALCQILFYYPESGFQGQKH